LAAGTSAARTSSGLTGGTAVELEASLLVASTAARGACSGPSWWIDEDEALIADGSYRVRGTGAAAPSLSGA